MSFRISGLPAEPFLHLFALSDAELRHQGAVRKIAEDSGYPCRISLTDAKAGDEVILVNYEHQGADTPYRSRHAIYVRKGERRYESAGEIPEQLRKRLLSVRAFDAEGMMVTADVTEGKMLEPLIDKFFVDDQVAYIHLHYARQGCYAARVDRA
ncbi:MAG TPA: DUF1203 domain-containing protein [Dongiaceae bacterium]|jgi:hypothetical protein|nr:DUF1203 domain-containing protein [Dongiaceae bacterium]